MFTALVLKDRLVHQGNKILVLTYNTSQTCSSVEIAYFCLNLDGTMKKLMAMCKFRLTSNASLETTCQKQWHAEAHMHDNHKLKAI